jgi:hypothetical protein
MKKQEPHILFNNSFTVLYVTDFKLLEQDTGKPKKTHTFLSTFQEKELPPFPESILQIEVV